MKLQKDTDLPEFWELIISEVLKDKKRILYLLILPALKCVLWAALVVAISVIVLLLFGMILLLTQESEVGRQIFIQLPQYVPYFFALLFAVTHTFSIRECLEETQRLLFPDTNKQVDHGAISWCKSLLASLALTVFVLGITGIVGLLQYPAWIGAILGVVIISPFALSPWQAFRKEKGFLRQVLLQAKHRPFFTGSIVLITTVFAGVIILLCVHFIMWHLSGSSSTSRGGDIYRLIYPVTIIASYAWALSVLSIVFLYKERSHSSLQKS